MGRARAEANARSADEPWAIPAPWALRTCTRIFRQVRCSEDACRVWSVSSIPTHAALFGGSARGFMFKASWVRSLHRTRSRAVACTRRVIKARAVDLGGCGHPPRSLDYTTHRFED